VEDPQPPFSVRQSLAHLLNPLHAQDDRQNLATMGTKGEAPEGACSTGCRLPLQQQPSGAGGVGVPGFAQFPRSPAVCLICSEFASALMFRFFVQLGCGFRKTRTPSPSVSTSRHPSQGVGSKDNTAQRRRQVGTVSS